MDTKEQSNNFYYVFDSFSLLSAAWPLARNSFCFRFVRRRLRSARATTSTTMRSRYLPQEGHARCGRLSAPHAHAAIRMPRSAWWLRRLPDFERFARIRTTMIHNIPHKLTCDNPSQTKRAAQYHYCWPHDLYTVLVLASTPLSTK